MRIYIIGVGLIGGSFAFDLRAIIKDALIYGIDTRREHLDEAISLGIIDQIGDMDQIENADLVLISIPVDANVEVIISVLDKIKDDCLVIDTGSTKSRLCTLLKDHPKRRNFLAAHPIAGTEYSGPQAAIPNLYRNKTMIICEVEKTAFKLQEKALELFQKIGMRI